MTPYKLTNGGGFGVEVSSARAINCDGTRVLVLASTPPAVLDHFALFTTNGTFIKDLPIQASAEPRWSRTQGTTLYYVSGNSLMIFDVSGDHPSTVWQFNEYVELTPDGRNGVSGRGESDISADGDHFILSGVRQDGSVDVFTYSLKDGKGQVFSHDTPFDGLKITASNRMILSRDDGIWEVV